MQTQSQINKQANKEKSSAAITGYTGIFRSEGRFLLTGVKVTTCKPGKALWSDTLEFKSCCFFF
jgi:hypothetical protein